MTTQAPVLTRTMPMGMPAIIGRAGIALIMMAAATATWGLIKFPMGGVADMFLLAAIGLAGIATLFGDLRFKLPWWVFVPPVAILICVIVRQLDATPYYLRVLRYQVTYYKPESVVKGAFWIFAMLAVPLGIAACTGWDRRVPRWVMGSYVTGVAISSLVALTDLAGLTHVSEGIGYASNNLRQPGLTEHPNTLGFTCVISIPFVVYFISTVKRKWQWLPALAFIILLGGVAATGSRGAQVMVPVVLLGSFLFVKNKRETARTVALAVSGALLVAVTLLITVLPANIRDDLYRFGSSTSATQNSNDDRLILLRLAVGDFSRYPIFGAGIRHVVEAHNIYLQILAAGGVVLGIAMLVYWGAILFDCWTLGRLDNSFGYYLLISIIAWMILGAIENQLTDRHFYYTVGCIAAISAFRSTPDEESSVFPPPAQRSS